MTFSLIRKVENGDVLLMVKGPKQIITLLQEAFPTLQYSAQFEDRFKRFDWGVYIKGTDQETEASLQLYLRSLQTFVYMEDDLYLSYALMRHSLSIDSSRSLIGQIVRDAKPYDREFQPTYLVKAKELAGHLVHFIQLFPLYRKADMVVAMPYLEKPFDLPTALVKEVCSLTGQEDGSCRVKKNHLIKQMKNCTTDQERNENIKGAFSADPLYFKEKVIIVIDDIYDSGASINELGRTIRDSGAKHVLGLTATKTWL